MSEDDFKKYRTCAIAVPPSEQADPVSMQAIMDSIDSDKGTQASRSCAVMAKLAQLWENGLTITYTFLDGTAKQQNKVNKVVKEWSIYANLTFEYVTGDADVRISFDPETGSWSYVGTTVRTIPKDKATMNLGWIDDTDDISPDEHGVILHEWGHTIGLMHEHQSPGRGKKITLDEDKVYAYYMATQGWSKETVKAQIIDVYNVNDVSNYSEVDLTSIMMYFMPAELNLEHTAIHINNQLSDLDKAYVVINYPRPMPDPQAPEWTLDHALEVAKISDKTATSMKGAINEGVVLTKVRSDFANTMAALRAPNDPSHTLSPSTDDWCESDLLVEDTPSDVQRGFILKNNLWTPNTTIKYGFIDGKTAETQGTKYQKDRVRKALDDYQMITSLKFEFVDLSPLDMEKGVDRSVCQVRISFGPAIRHAGRKTYGWSYPGTSCILSRHNPANATVLGGQKWTTTFLGDQPSHAEDSVNIAMADRTLYHELGHMLGLNHEHNSPHSIVQNKNPPPAAYFVATLFDKDSVMLYEKIPYKDNPGQVTTVNVTPSITDKSLLSLLYPDSGNMKSNFASALVAFNFQDLKSILGQAAAALAPGAKPALINNLRLFLASDINLKPRLATQPKVQRGLQNIGGGGGTLLPGFVMELVDTLKQFFSPGGNQMFTLQFPGRFLQQSEFAWDTSSAGIYGQFLKPITVNEAEFRLVDQLYDLTDRVAGPNGTNLSIVYEQLLNNLLPKFVNSGLGKQQAQIRQWLLKEVPTNKWVDDIMARQQQREKNLADTMAKGTGATTSTGGATMPGDNTGDTPSFALAPRQSFATGDGQSAVLNRIELSEILMSEYLYAKQEWELERDALISQANQPQKGTAESQQALDALTRKLAHITATRQAQLASKYADAVVLGHSHDVREYLGYLDISSPAEALQKAKDSLRESAMSSLNGAMNVYPVQLAPIDWFEGLSTSFKPEDLTSDPEIIRIAIDAKSRQLDTLNAQLVALEMGARGDPAQLQKAVEDAQTTLDAAQSTLAQNYTSNVINVAKTCLDANGQVDTGLVSKKVQIAQPLLDNLPTQMDAVRVAQDQLTAASRALSQSMAAHALAEATDTQQQQKQLQIEIQSITKDLNDLQTRWQLLTAATGGVNPPPKSDVINEALPTGPVQLPEDVSTGGSRWQTITMTSTSTTRGQKSDTTSKASSEQWSLNLWIASGSGSSSSAIGNSDVSTTASDDSIDLAFRATLVTVDRGGWFQPQFFTESQAFYKVNKDVSWTDDKPSGVKGLMPGYPVAFLIAKDIVIRVTHSQQSSDDTKKFDQESSASSGGILCFSYSRSNSSSSETTSSNFQSFANGFLVKIPGPQILGYIIEKTGEDQAVLMPDQLPDGFFIPDDSYDVQPAATAAAAIQHHPAIENPSDHSISSDKLREVLSKLVNEQLDSIVAKAISA